MRTVAGIISVLFHPLILLNFGIFSILRYHPYFVSKFYESHFYTISMFIAVNTLIMPLLSVYLLKKFRFIDDFAISNPRQRLLPYGILVMLLIFTIFQLYKIELKGLPLIFMGASAVCLLLNILINLRFTISTHAIGSGGLAGLYFFLTLNEHLSVFNFLLLCSVVLAGLSAWARLYLNAHTEKQIYSGFILGLSVVVLTCMSFA